MAEKKKIIPSAEHPEDEDNVMKSRIIELEERIILLAKELLYLRNVLDSSESDLPSNDIKPQE